VILKCSGIYPLHKPTWSFAGLQYYLLNQLPSFDRWFTNIKKIGLFLLWLLRNGLARRHINADDRSQRFGFQWLSNLSVRRWIEVLTFFMLRRIFTTHDEQRLVTEAFVFGFLELTKGQICFKQLLHNP